jgi:hypothetical protein
MLRRRWVMRLAAMVDRIATGIGMGLTFVSLTLLSSSELSGEDAGLASG